MQDRTPLDWKRLSLFFVISLGVLVGWQALFPPPPPPEPAPALAPAAETAEIPPDSADSPVEVASSEPAPEAIGEAAVRRESVTVGEMARVELTNVGGRITSWKLLQHGQYGAPAQGAVADPVELVRRPLLPRPAPSPGAGPAGAPVATVAAERGPVPDDAALLPLQVVTGRTELDERLAKALHRIEVSEDAGSPVVTLSWSDGLGTSVEKRLTFDPKWPLARVEAHLTIDGRPASFHLTWGPGLGNPTRRERDNTYFKRTHVAYRAGGDVERQAGPGEQPALAGGLPVDWAGLADSFFAVLFLPGEVSPAGPPLGGFEVLAERPTETELLKEARKGWLRRKFSREDFSERLLFAAPFRPEAPVQTVYVGPRSRVLLRELDEAATGARSLSDVMDVGLLEPITGFMHRLLLWLHDHTASWGVSILLLTVIIRAALFPLTHFSLKKVRIMQDRMKVIRPKQEALKEKYRKLPRSLETRQREQEELMTLFRSAGITPGDQLMGCLPILLSMPFFFALFQLLPQATEFRHQSFLWWSDLSSRDPTHVWPLLTGLTMFISSKLSASSTSSLDPVTRNMLFMFPLFFTYICWGAPLGLVVYWTTSNVIQIGQQYLLTLTLPPSEDQTAKAGRKPPRTPRGSERLADTEAALPRDTAAPAAASAGGKKRRKR